LAIALNPNLEYLSGNFILLKQRLGDWDQLSDDLEELVSRIHGGEKVIAPFALHSLMDTPELQKQCSAIYADHRYPKSMALPKIEPYQGHEKIRIGYFSPDFYSHPVTTGIADLFKLHDRSKFEIHAFGFGEDRKDGWNIRVREEVDFFHDVHKISDKDVALLSRSLEIDIAVDLCGYTKGNRTGIFAMSVAPIQLHYIGFLGTMGTGYYDYIISDRVMIPEANKDYYTENIVYLPSYQVNSRQPHSPDTSLDRQYFGIPEDVFVFCCFNNALKITPDVFDSWARILSEVKDSVLMLYVGNDVAIKNYQKQISARGIDSSRLIFTGQLSGSSYWSRYQAVDLFLDTFYYSGGMTSSDALRVGCPVLTWMGDSFSSRFGASILTSLGLSELITSKQSEYEALAIRLAKNPKEFEVLRDKLAANLSIKPLYNTQQFADSIEAAYQEMHDQNQSGEKPTDIYIDQREKQYE
jgi:predicted O-linked N-acetylglucosamine transferase (SPINDLY family)